MREVCGELWLSDQLRNCTATSYGASGPCLAHHPNRGEIIGARAAGGHSLSLRECEIDADLVRLLTAVAFRPEGNSRFDFKGATFTTKVDFNGAVFPGEVDFRNSVFMSETQLYNVTFSEKADFAGAVFMADVYCYGTTFAASANFNRVKYQAAANFSGTAFSANVNFHDAEFSGEVAFDGVNFVGDARFNRALFEYGASFQKATFGATAAFNQTQFNADTNFRGTSFAGGAVFDVGSDSTGRVLLRRVTFGRRLHLNEHSRVSLDDVTVSSPLSITSNAPTNGLLQITGSHLSAPVLVDPLVQMTNTRFDRTVGLDQLRFRGDAGWPEVERRFRSWPPQLTRRQVIADEFDETTNRPSDDRLEIQYRQLRSSLEASKAHAAANDFYWGELDARRRRQALFGTERVLLTLYRTLLGYGVRASRPFAWWLATVATLTVLFNSRSDELLSPNVPNHHWGRSLAFVLQNSTNLLRSLDTGLEWDGTLLVLFGRMVTVTLIAGTFLALRSRVSR